MISHIATGPTASSMPLPHQIPAAHVRQNAGTDGQPEQRESAPAEGQHEPCVATPSPFLGSPLWKGEMLREENIEGDA